MPQQYIHRVVMRMIGRYMKWCKEVFIFLIHGSILANQGLNNLLSLRVR